MALRFIKICFLISKNLLRIHLMYKISSNQPQTSSTVAELLELFEETRT